MKDPTFVKPDQQTVNFVELFFDLIFVFSITQVVNILHQEISWMVILQLILIFWLVWWAWGQFTWALNAANTKHPVIQLSVLAATGVAFFMAVGVPQAFGAGALGFALPYILVRIIGNGILFIVSIENPSFSTGLRTWLLLSIGGIAAVLIGALLGGQIQFWLWGLAILLDIYAASVSGGEQYDWSIKPAHFAERHGLFVIIVLGETLILAASGVTGALWTGELIGVAILAVALTGGLWWTYFPVSAPALEHVFSQSKGGKLTMIGTGSYTFMHFVLLAGLIAYAAVLEQAISHPGEALALPELWALALGIFLFVAGMSAALWFAEKRINLPRVLIVLASSVLILATAGVPVMLTLAIALIGIVGVGLNEQKIAGGN